MTTLRFARDIVTVWRVPLITDRSRQIRDYAHAEPERDVTRCQVDPAEDEELLVNRNAELSAWRVKAPGTADIADDDLIKYRGDTYRIEGSVQRQGSPTGRLEHLTFMMVRWKG